MAGRGVGRMEWGGGGKWDNCNSIINKYIKKSLSNSDVFSALGFIVSAVGKRERRGLKSRREGGKRE